MFRYRSCYLILLLPPANEVWGKVIFSEACVKNSVHRREGGLPQCMLGYHHPSQDQAGTPQDQAPPWDQAGRYPLPQDQAPPRARHPSEPGTPPGTRHHPPQSRACWEIRSTSRRYASYCNAFLFSNMLPSKFRYIYIGLIVALNLFTNYHLVATVDKIYFTLCRLRSFTEVGM